MPELPEVETIKRGLEQKIIGSKILNIEILNPKSFQGDPSTIKNFIITKVWRRAKILGIDLEPIAKLKTNDQRLRTLLFHLKMSGQIILVANKDKLVGGHPTNDMLGPMPNKSTRVIFKLSKSKLYFNDQRKFGWIKLVNTSDLENLNYGLATSIGPEPLEKDFTWNILKTNLSRRAKIPVKVAIMDPEVVAGVGNIYANEACFLAHLLPSRKVATLTDSDYKRLHKAIIKSLEMSIASGGSTKRDYVNESGEKGNFLNFAYVYDRKGLECKVCHTPIAKITLAGRGSYFCPKCQK